MTVGSAIEVNHERRALQDHLDELDPAHRAALAEVGHRLLAIARVEMDRSIQADLWDALAYCGYTPEGAATVA